MKKILLSLVVLLLTLAGCGGNNQNQGAQNNQNQNNQFHTREQQIQTPEQKPGELNTKKQNKPEIQTIGFLEPVAPDRAVSEVNKVGKHLTNVAFFSYRVKADGSLISLEDAKPLEAVRKSDATPMMVLTNFTEGNFSAEVAHKIFTDKKTSKQLINNVLTTMKNKGFKSLNIDFEHIKAEDRDLYNGFLETIIPKVKDAGYTVSTALAPKTSAEQGGAWHGAHDYKRHGQLADFVILMTYEWGWSGGPPRAVAPIPEVRDVLDYAVSVIPSKKIVMGVPLYGYDWKLPYEEGKPWAKRVAPKEARQLAAKEGAQVKYDDEAQSPYFNYTDDNGKKHVIWFENENSVQAKYNLVKEYGLRGVAYWVLGEPFPTNWDVLRETFKIKKTGQQ